MTPNRQARRGAGQPHPDALDGQGHDAAPLDERKVRAIVREELRTLFARVVSEEQVYSSRKGHGAPGLSDEANKRIALAIGRRRGRWYVYTAAELAAYEAGDRDAKPANDAPAPSTWHPSMAAGALGLRPIRGSR